MISKLLLIGSLKRSGNSDVLEVEESVLIAKVTAIIVKLKAFLFSYEKWLPRDLEVEDAEFEEYLSLLDSNEFTFMLFTS